MKIGLIGYGRMGKAVEEIAVERGHKIVFAYDKNDRLHDLQKADVIVEFSVPGSAFDNISRCLAEGIPVVSGTTGWLDKWEDIVRFCHEHQGAFLYASNFSIGVNIFFALNEYLAKMMKGRGYDVKIKEVHHLKKLDAPSGTAVKLAEDILPYTDYTHWENTGDGKEALAIESIREGEVKGYHEVRYQSGIDAISISHKAFSRKGFALGAVMAAEFLHGKKGIYSMRDVLQLH